MGQHPKLRIELTLTDRFIDPIEEGADVTIRIAELADSSLIARKLAPGPAGVRRLPRLYRKPRRAASSPRISPATPA